MLHWRRNGAGPGKAGGRLPAIVHFRGGHNRVPIFASLYDVKASVRIRIQTAVDKRVGSSGPDKPSPKKSTSIESLHHTLFNQHPPKLEYSTHCSLLTPEVGLAGDFHKTTKNGSRGFRKYIQLSRSKNDLKQTSSSFQRTWSGVLDCGGSEGRPSSRDRICDRHAP